MNHSLFIIWRRIDDHPCKRGDPFRPFSGGVCLGLSGTRLGTGCPGLQPSSWTHPVRPAVFCAALACLALFFAPGFNGSVHAQDDGLPVVTVQDTALSVAEVTHGVSVCAVASSAGDLPMRVQAKTVSGTATEGEDFRAASASLVPTPNGSCWCFIRELLLTFSLSSTTCDSAWVSRGFSVIKHV